MASYRAGCPDFMVFENCFFKHLQSSASNNDNARQIMRSTHAASQLSSSRSARGRGVPEPEDTLLTRFDLKGSWVNRSVLQSGEAETTDKTLKDNDLREKFYLMEAEEDAMVRQLANDTDFLSRNGLMDYSLLVGVHKGECAMNALDGSAEGDGRTGFMAAATLPVARKYYFGLIDILQKFDWTKKYEMYAKGLLGQDVAGLSSINPTDYRLRFVEKMKQHIEGVRPRERWAPDVLPRMINHNGAMSAAAPEQVNEKVRDMVRDMGHRLRLGETEKNQLESTLSQLSNIIA